MPSGERIRKRRDKLEISQEVLIERLKTTWPCGWPKLTKEYISKIEGDKRRLLARELPHFAAALNCDLQELVDPIPD